MLLIDGVRYLETPPKDEDELEQAVIEHAQEIFGENSIYLDLKHKIKSKSGVGSIPDGYAIILGKAPQWHVVEVELSSHPLHDHIVAQIGKFVSGIRNPNTQTEIVSAIYDEISADAILMARIRKAIGASEIYKCLTEVVATTPTVTIIIEKATPELDDALDSINHPLKKVIEFRTFVRENADRVDAHLFEAISSPKPLIVSLSLEEHESTSLLSAKTKLRKRVTINDLVNASMLEPDQVLFKVYNGKWCAGRITADGLIKLIDSGKSFDSPSGAASSITGGQVDGWNWWLTNDKDSNEITLDMLRKKLEGK